MLPMGRVVAFVLACSFLAAAAGFWAGTTRHEAPTRADVEALQDMLTHHEQAVEMSIIALGQDLPSPVRVYVQEVIIEQRLEVGIILDTLTRWNEPIEGGPAAMGWMGERVPRDEMPGLLPGAEIERLRAAEGRDAASLWLAMMSLHHAGGAEMARAALTVVRDDHNQDLFRRIVVAQVAEIQEYSRLRRTLYLDVPPGYTDPPQTPSMASHSDDPHGGDHESLTWLLAAPVAAAVAALLARSSRRGTVAGGRSTRTLAAILPAAASAASGAIHLAMTGPHFDEAFTHGLFFLGLGAFQLITAGLVALDLRRRLFAVMAAGNATAVGVWLLSRTLGLPVGPERWVPEAVGPADVATTVLEVAIVATCWIVFSRAERGDVSPDLAGSR